MYRGLYPCFFYRTRNNIRPVSIFCELVKRKLKLEYSDNYYNKESSIVLKKIKAETFIKAFDHLNSKIHYAAKNGLISLKVT